MAFWFVISKLFYAYVIPAIVCQSFYSFALHSCAYILLVITCPVLILASLELFRGVLQNGEDNYKWVRREWRLLDALIKDVKYVSESRKKIDEKAHQIRDSQLRLPGVTVRISDAEKNWVEITKKLIREEGCNQIFGRQRKRDEILMPVYWGNLIKFHADLYQIKLLIRDHIRNKETDARDIYGSLEISRSIVRRLQDRPLEEHKSCVYKRAEPTLSIEEKLNELIAKNQGSERIQYSIKLPLALLLAFLRDLEGLKFESETEMAWVKEAEEIIHEVEHDIDSIQGMSWIPPFLYAKPQLRRCCIWVETVIWDLFERKDKYGFTFISRDRSRSVRLPQPPACPPQAIDCTGATSLLDNIKNQLNQEPIKVANHLKQLCTKIEHVCHLLEDAEAAKGIKHSREAWTDQFNNIVRDAENSLRTYRQSSVSKRIKRQKKTDPLAKFSKAIGRLNNALELLEICIKVCRIELREETNLVVGLEEDTHEVISQLTNRGENCSTLCIEGMKGIGKTTLAKTVYNHRAIHHHFEFRAWVSLPDEVADDNELENIIGSQIMPTTVKPNAKDQYYWIREVHDFLWDKKYLVVLDNISTKEEWHTLKSAFPNSTNGSRIVLTTRYKDVASHVNQNSVSHQLRLQTKDESWDLFTQVVRLPSETSQPEISPDVDIQKVKKIAEKLVGRCGGLPLSILRLGYLLSGTKRVTSEELSRVLEHMDHNQTPWLETLELNEKDLPSHLRQCLSYFGLFPRDSEIPARRLVALWVAEGLAKPSGDELEPLESVAKKYLSELISRNLVQVVEKKLNGKVKRCGFPNALRELWLQRYPRSSLVQRLIICFDENDASSSNNHASSTYIQNKLLSCRRPPSMLYFDSREGNKPGEDSGNLLRKGIAGGHLLQLQVIDLEHVFRPQLPSTIRRLTHLTYLSLRWTFLETIPSSIGNLVNLQTLDVKHTYIRTLPSSIWKLLKLRHLYMDQIYRSKIEHHPRGSFLPNLQTLQGAFVDKDSPLKDGLHRLANLRKLILAFQLKLSEQEVFAESLLELKHLQFLKLKSIDEMGRPQDLMVKCLSGLEKLSSLYLFGKLDPSIIKDGFLQSLTELTLSASRLSDDPIPELEKLHNIKSLSLYSGSYIGNSMVCSIGGFPQLLVLKFWMLQELELWTIEQQAMPKLKQLEIRSCKRLRVPAGLSHLKNLRELKLKDMPVEFTAEIKESSMEQMWGDIAISPAIIIDKQ